MLLKRHLIRCCMLHSYTDECRAVYFTQYTDEYRGFNVFSWGCFALEIYNLKKSTCYSYPIHSYTDEYRTVYLHSTPMSIGVLREFLNALYSSVCVLGKKHR